MATEARIIRVLETLEYPGVEGLRARDASARGRSFFGQPHELAMVVSWLEDRKVRGCAIEDRAALRVPGPAWENAFLDYLGKIECPYDLAAGAPGDSAGSPAVVRGLSWLVSKAVACEFEDRGTEYNAAAREVLTEATPFDGPSVMSVEVEEEDGKTMSWSQDFLSALETACQAFGVEIPANAQPFPPSPPSQSPVTPPATTTGNISSVDPARRGDTSVVRALEALLEAAKDRRLALDMAHTTMNTEGGVGIVDGGGDGLAGFAAGVCTGDEAIDRVATVLRMLFLLNLRELQDEINAILAHAQSIKAS